MRYHPDQKEKTRRRVLEEATKAIRRQGPYRLGVAGVMNQAGLTHGGFYAHFSSKDALVSAAIGAMFDGALERWTRATHDRPPEAGLAAYIESYLSAEHGDTRGGGCPLAALASDLPRLAAPSRTAFAAGGGGGPQAPPPPRRPGRPPEPPPTPRARRYGAPPPPPPTRPATG